MTEHLVFTLSATLGSMGELAGYQRRGTLLWPGRSEVMGLLGAALGIRRDGDFSALEPMQTAVAVFDAGSSLRDYHTVETVPSAKVKSPQTRREALRAETTNTMITLRDYRTTPLYGVAVWGIPLEPLVAALNTPSYVLYLGRKACTLSAPLGPRIVESDGAAEALSQIILPPWREKAVATTLITDAPGQGELIRYEERHDLPLDRQLWHFSARSVAVEAVEIRPEAAT